MTTNDIEYIVEQTILQLSDDVARKYSPTCLEQKLKQVLHLRCETDEDYTYRDELVQEFKEEIEEAKNRIKRITYNVQADFDDEIA